MESMLNMAAGTTMEIGYQEGFGSEDLKLLEVDESMLQELSENGLVIRGGFDEEAVLCTSSCTYAIKFVMSSNTVLVMPPPSKTSSNPNDNNHTAKASAMSAVSGHMELVQTVPNIERLKTMLHKRPFTEEDVMESDGGVNADLYTFDDLLQQNQMSEKELRDALKSLAAIQISNYWRVVDENYMQELLELIVLTAVTNDWSLQALRESDVVSMLSADGYNPQLVSHCLATFGHKVTSTEDSEQNVSIADDSIASGTDIWKLDERHICLHYAKQLLSSPSVSKWKLEDFVDAWQQKLPSGVQASVDMLKGEALIEKIGADSWLRPFSVSSLSSNPPERFAALFRERPRWDWKDLEPYVSDLRAPGKSVEAILLKYTRKTQPTADASPIFTAR